jgi:hypothetical protein
VTKARDPAVTIDGRPIDPAVLLKATLDTTEAAVRSWSGGTITRVYQYASKVLESAVTDGVLPMPRQARGPGKVADVHADKRARIDAIMKELGT